MTEDEENAEKMLMERMKLWGPVGEAQMEQMKKKRKELESQK